MKWSCHALTRKETKLNKLNVNTKLTKCRWWRLLKTIIVMKKLHVWIRVSLKTKQKMSLLFCRISIIRDDGDQY